MKITRKVAASPSMSSPNTKAKEAPAAGEDLVLVVGRAPEGQGFDVLRKRNERVEAGRVKPLEEGKAIDGEVVKLEARPETPLLFDAKVQYTPPTASVRSQGPGQVASRSYRRNWERVFGRQAKPSKALN